VLEFMKPWMPVNSDARVDLDVRAVWSQIIDLA